MKSYAFNFTRPMAQYRTKYDLNAQDIFLIPNNTPTVVKVTDFTIADYNNVKI